VVAYPTETFYGLGVDAFSDTALARLRALKGEGRGEKAVSMLIEGPAMLDRLIAEIPPAAAELMRRYWPGALTMALPARSGLPAALVSDGCVAVRQSPHPIARALVARFGGPVTTTSANRAGDPPATTPAAVARALGTACHLLDGGATPGGLPSTLVRVRGAEVEILRRGAVELAVDS
jgi:L-threonylcarbamoyladenylate synthase